MTSLVLGLLDWEGGDVACAGLAGLAGLSHVSESCSLTPYSIVCGDSLLSDKQRMMYFMLLDVCLSPYRYSS